MKGMSKNLPKSPADMGPISISERDQIYCAMWGRNSAGQLASQKYSYSHHPRLVRQVIHNSSIKEGFFSVSGGDNHTLFMTDALTVWGCGSNVYGQLGHGNEDTTREQSPIRDASATPAIGRAEHEPFTPLKAISALGGSVEVESISCGAEHSLALTTKGQVYSWGLNCEGQLGHGNFKNIDTPCIIEALLPNGNATKPEPESSSTSAERKTPQLEEGVASSLLSYLKRTTGGSNSGSRNTGINSRGKSHESQRVVPQFFNKTVGGYTYMQDRLGRGTQMNVQQNPTIDIGGLSRNNQISSKSRPLGGSTTDVGQSNKFSKSMDFSNASKADGSAILADESNRSLLGITPRFLMQQSEQVVELACGAVHTLLRTNMGRVFASGFGGSFALGTESNQTTSKFEPVPALMQHYHAVAKNIACGMYHSGCVTEDGRVFLWGMYTPSSRERQSLVYSSPTPLFGFGSPASATNSSKSSSSKESSTIEKQSGPMVKRRLSSVQQSSSGVMAQSIAMGEYFTIIVTETNRLYSLGSNSCGQLGVLLQNNEGDILDESLSPVQLNSIPKQINQVACGLKHVLAISSDYQLYAWGHNGYGQLGFKSSGNVNKPTKVPCFEDSQPFKVCCGSYHSLCLSYSKPRLSRNPESQAAEQMKSLQSAISQAFDDEGKEKQGARRGQGILMNNMQQLPINEEVMSKLMLEIQSLKRALTIEKATTNALRKELEETEKKISSRDLSPREKQALRKKENKRDDAIALQLEHRYLPPNFEINHQDLVFEKKISEGGCGIVYKGRWKHTLVAIKEIKKEIIHQEKLDEFINECSIMEAVRHPNIVMFLGASTKPPKLCIVLEYCPRGSLWNLLHDFQFKLSWEVRRRIALDIAKGVYYLHSFPVPVLHRDLKSLNVLLDASFNAKLADFGWTRIKANVMTAKIGTYQWMAPEVITSHKYTEKADVFSFGVLLWELATRKPPYYGMEGTEVGRKVVEENLRPKISEKECPPQLLSLMRRCWDKDASKRPSFKEIIIEMESYNFKHLDQPSSHKK